MHSQHNDTHAQITAYWICRCNLLAMSCLAASTNQSPPIAKVLCVVVSTFFFSGQKPKNMRQHFHRIRLELDRQQQIWINSWNWFASSKCQNDKKCFSCESTSMPVWRLYIRVLSPNPIPSTDKRKSKYILQYCWCDRNDDQTVNSMGKYEQTESLSIRSARKKKMVFSSLNFCNVCYFRCCSGAFIVSNDLIHIHVAYVRQPEGDQFFFGFRQKKRKKHMTAQRASIDSINHPSERYYDSKTIYLIEYHHSVRRCAIPCSVKSNGIAIQFQSKRQFHVPDFFVFYFLTFSCFHPRNTLVSLPSKWDVCIFRCKWLTKQMRKRLLQSLSLLWTNNRADERREEKKRPKTSRESIKLNQFTFYIRFSVPFPSRQPRSP